MNALKNPVMHKLWHKSAAKTPTFFKISDEPNLYRPASKTGLSNLQKMVDTSAILQAL